MSATAVCLDSDACYRALLAHDTRFDGQFFTGVTSTGIYCRPVCRVRTPKPQNCQFYALAAQAEAAGFRPCLRCRPELAPAATVAWSTQDASALLAQQATGLLDALARDRDVDSAGLSGMAGVAARLGVSERHLRRIFEAQWGISPLQYLQTRRLLCAKHLLTDTPLPISQVAALSGFASLRRFNAAFVAHYRLQPRGLRQGAAEEAPARSKRPGASVQGLVLKASYRPPYDVAALLAFLQQRAIPGVEAVDMAAHSYQRSLALDHQGQRLTGWVQACFVAGTHGVEFRISESLLPALPRLMADLRQLLDLDADPTAIALSLGARFAGLEGLRVPGTLDGLELAVRGILGQQITVAAARTLAARLVQALGQPLPAQMATPFPALTHTFPSAAVLAEASGETLGSLGIVRQRQAAIQALARAVACGSIHLRPGADVAQTMAALQALPGIGPWTASYIAMRALRWPDAFPAGDVALHTALGLRQHKTPAVQAERLSQAWRPWRSYAVVRAWHSLSLSKPTPLPGA
ncbi:adenosine deaminase [Rhodoferax lacus]|uniref:DNA-3-methyladenine glycosylase II n=1 Tax=Rhodoferax lacus TaxID=2184758 RepID=A0A3E1RHR5_9BURK|nr:AlkA N-terminal domain-containing protein [Rhodoferax lacus]RFO98160.1 adenosine deaminase [Rhodoferax lacus]